MQVSFQVHSYCPAENEHRYSWLEVDFRLFSISWTSFARKEKHFKSDLPNVSCGFGVWKFLLCTLL